MNAIWYINSIKQQSKSYSTMEKNTIKIGDNFRNADEVFNDAIIYEVVKIDEANNIVTCNLYQNHKYQFTWDYDLNETIEDLQNGTYVFMAQASRKEIIQKVNETQKTIKSMKNENRNRMCEVIVSILKEKGGKLTADDWENVLNENLEITFISADGTYINYFCEVNSIELFEMNDGTPNFTIACEESNDLPEYALSYDNVYKIFETLSSCWYFTQR